MINIDLYPFFGFLGPELTPWEYKNRCFLVGLPHLMVRRQNLSSKQKAFSLAGKNTKVVLESFDAWKYVPTAVLDIPKVPRRHLLQQMNYQRGSQKITSGIGVSPTNILAFLSLFQFLTKWPHYQKYVNH